MKRIGLTLMAILLVAFPLFSQIINIPSDFSTIQAGIDNAADGDTVLVADSTYYENINFKGKHITVASHFILKGDTSHISKTIIDGSQPNNPDTTTTVLMISDEDENSVLCGFTITGGSGTRMEYPHFDGSPENLHYLGGGGILVFDCGGTIRNNIITNNTLTWTTEGVVNGAGIDVVISEADRSNGRSLIIEHNSIINNILEGTEDGASGAGAGMMIGVNSSSSETGMDIIVQNNLISHNRVLISSPQNGAVGAGCCLSFMRPLRNGNYVFRNNLVTHNGNEYATSPPMFFEGAGVYIAYTGKGQSSNSAPLIYNNIIAENYSTDMAGGIGVYFYNSNPLTASSIQPIIFNNTVVNNRAPKSPGLDAIRANPLLVNNIFWNPEDNPNTGEFSSSSSNILSFHNNIRGSDNPGEGNISAEPNFIEDSYKMIKGSPGIGAGTMAVDVLGNSYEVPNLDFFNNPRPDSIDMRVDMGAIESPFEGSVFIPDTAFLHALIDEGVDINEDSLISYDEAEVVDVLDLNGGVNSLEEIVDLTGIGAFLNLERLYCRNNQLDELDVSTNENLRILGCSRNNLTYIKVNDELEFLDCSDNKLVSLDLASNQGLGKGLGWPSMTSPVEDLNLSNNPNLNRVSVRDGFIPVTGWEGDWCPCLWGEGVGPDPHDADSVCVDTSGSPNVYFITEGSGTIVYPEYGNEEFKIYPNPTHTLLNVKTEYPDHYSINITTLNGQQILIGEMDATSHQLDLSTFQKGVYFITIRSKDFISTRKIIKL